MKSFLFSALAAHVHSWLNNEESQIVCLCFGARIKEFTAFWFSIVRGKLTIYRASIIMDIVGNWAQLLNFIQ